MRVLAAARIGGIGESMAALLHLRRQADTQILVRSLYEPVLTYGWIARAHPPVRGPAPQGNETRSCMLTVRLPAEWCWLERKPRLRAARGRLCPVREALTATSTPSLNTLRSSWRVDRERVLRGGPMVPGQVTTTHGRRSWLIPVAGVGVALAALRVTNSARGSGAATSEAVVLREPGPRAGRDARNPCPGAVLSARDGSC